MKPGSHILVVDDDAFFRDLLREVLTEHGYKVSEAVDGIDALKFLQQTSVDMVVADLEMPNMNGLDLTRQLKKERPQFPIVMVTAYAALHTPSDILAAGVDAFLQKPVPMDKLVKIIEQL
jgi:CheY-like chemotaxis protein